MNRKPIGEIIGRTIQRVEVSNDGTYYLITFDDYSRVSADRIGIYDDEGMILSDEGAE